MHTLRTCVCARSTYMHAQTAHMCIHTLHTLYVHAQVSCNKALHDTDCPVIAVQCPQINIT